MTNEKTQTGQFIKYPNGHIASIYKQMTKNGLRFYRYSRGRFFPISKTEVELLNHTL
jgi:hypothetical protein